MFVLNITDNRSLVTGYLLVVISINISTQSQHQSLIKDTTSVRHALIFGFSNSENSKATKTIKLLRFYDDTNIVQYQCALNVPYQVCTEIVYLILQKLQKAFNNNNNIISYAKIFIFIYKIQLIIFLNTK